jgi:hypothetical protein
MPIREDLSYLSEPVPPMTAERMQQLQLAAAEAHFFDLLQLMPRPWDALAAALAERRRILEGTVDGAENTEADEMDALERQIIDLKADVRDWKGLLFVAFAVILILVGMLAIGASLGAL